MSPAKTLSLTPGAVTALAAIFGSLAGALVPASARGSFKGIRIGAICRVERSAELDSIQRQIILSRLLVPCEALLYDIIRRADTQSPQALIRKTWGTWLKGALWRNFASTASQYPSTATVLV